MRRKSIGLSIASLILTIIGGALLFLLPLMFSGTKDVFFMGATDIVGGMTNFVSNLGDMFIGFITGAFNITHQTMIGAEDHLVSMFVGYPILGLTAIFLILWIVLFIMLIVRKRPSQLATWIIGLLGGGVAMTMLLAANTGYVFNYQGVADEAITGLLPLIRNVGAINIWQAIVILAGMAILLVGFILGFIALCVGIDFCRKHPYISKKAIAEKQKAEEVLNFPTEKDANDEDALKAAQYDELTAAGPDTKEPVTEPVLVKEEKKEVPYIVQHFYYNAHGEPIPAPAKKEEPAPVKEEPKPEPAGPIHIEVKIPEGLVKAPEIPAPVVVQTPAPAPAPVVEEKKEEPKVEPAPVEEDNRPLTARELRAIIKEALDDHDHPDNDKPLTDDEARQLIRAELDNYYADAHPDYEEDVDEEYDDLLEDEKPALTEDDVRSILREELQSLKDELLKKEEPAPEPETVKEEVEEEVKEEVPPALTAEDVNKIVAEALDEKLIPLLEKAEEPKEEKPNVELEALKRKDMMQDDAIKDIQANLIKPEELRTIVAEQFDKLLAKLEEEKKVEEPVEEEPKPEPVPEVKPEPTPVVPQIIVNVPPAPAPAPAPAPVVEEKKEEPVKEEKPKIVRIPFPTRLLEADEEMKNNYNELKAECLSYGLKSRLSNTGDTFRLHTKTYVKITVAGKSLKLYFALDMKDYENSSLPLKFAGNKNIYKEIPVVFKVKSPLSLRRAKQLIQDACEKDNLEQGKLEVRDYADDLAHYVPQNAGADDEDEDDEE